MMFGILNQLAKGLRRFKRDESGSATLDFVLMLPGFMLIFTSAYESGVLSTRHVMLERGLDSTVREVRIGKIPNPSHDRLVERICEIASIIPDCTANVRLEMVPRDPRNWQDPPADVACVDRAEEGDPVLNFNTGLNNELMVLRACALFDPMIPTTGLGKEIPKESGGAYALVATSAYVMEPFQK
ncbi:Flp pilus assembly protein TadG [Cognatiyoonia koreensis]|uniref:Flp pilus assembly protein TadG n=1 Tax=Cognatiyoonia koreensis TaxID=364200 RepID=A0A1I0NAR6_9RHOB|nr:pilus assembly protein [Cognatiyoonia koreensis]SEV98261.1 Flp pilus assembly protein TadG [Cognatiyoonia koreensis]